MFFQHHWWNLQSLILELSISFGNLVFYLNGFNLIFTMFLLDDNSPREEHEKYAVEALRICREKINSGKYNVVILDEVNYAINLGLIDVQEIIKIIKEKPSNLDLVLTGRDVKEEIVELADLVTEMKEIKHPFKSGIKAKKGIDF
jgi:cob(I)alamin adenosyltransferase